MGEIEKKLAKKLKYQSIQKALLSVVAGGAFLSVAILAPNALQIFKKMGISGKRKREGISRARDTLLKNGMLQRDERGYLQITDRGLIKLQTKGELIEKPKRWDKKWRVLIFDIPERKRKIRTEIRHTLQSVGFVKLQDSVWVYPYNCEKFITLLKANLHIGKDLLYMIVDSIENDRHLKEEFGLKI